MKTFFKKSIFGVFVCCLAGCGEISDSAFHETVESSVRNAPNPTSEIAAIISVTHTCTGQCSCGSGICTYTYYSCALDSDEAAADASDACKNKYGESSTASGFVCVGSTDQCTPATDEYAPEFESELEYEEAVEIIE